MDNYNENLNAAAYESAVEINAKCEALDKITTIMSDKFVEYHVPTINILEGMKDDIAEIDVYDEFKEYKALLNQAEDCFAQMTDLLDRASYKANKIIEGE